MKFTVASLIVRLQTEKPDATVTVFLAPKGASLVDHIFVEETDHGIILDGYVNKDSQTFGIERAVGNAQVEIPLFIPHKSQQTVKEMGEDGWTFLLESRLLPGGEYRAFIASFSKGGTDGKDSSLSLEEAVLNAAHVARLNAESVETPEND